MSDQMIDEDRRILTEFLGECWHGWNGEKDANNYAVCSCGKILTLGEIGRFSCSIANRTFNTWEDFGALKDRIVEKAKMPEFIRYVVLGSRDLSVIRAMVWWERKHPLERCLLVLEALKQGALK